MTNLGLVLQYCFPNKQYILAGNEYSGLQWFDSSPKPTEEELANLEPTAIILAANGFADNERKLAYQTISDPIFFMYQRGEATEQEWLDAVQAIKDKYPKQPV